MSDRDTLYRLTEYRQELMELADEEANDIPSDKNSGSQVSNGFTKAMENIAGATSDTLEKFALQMYILDVAVKVRREQLFPYTVTERWPRETEEQQLYRSAIVKGFLSDVQTHWNGLIGKNDCDELTSEVSFLYAMVFPNKLKDGDAKTFITGVRATFRKELLDDIVQIFLGIHKSNCRLTYRGPLMPYDGIVRYCMGYFIQRTGFLPCSNEVYGAMCNVINYCSQCITRA